MKIEHEPTLDLYRGPGVCGWCRKWVSRREPHHLKGRGAGGWARLDIPINLIALCAANSGGDNCHDGHHRRGEPSYYDLLTMVAAREGMLQDEIEAEVNRLQAIPEDPGERRPKPRKPPKKRPDGFKCLLCRRYRTARRRVAVASGVICGKCWGHASHEVRREVQRKDGAA